MSKENKDIRIDCFLGCILLILLTISIPSSAYISYGFMLLGAFCAIALGIIIAKNNEKYSDKIFATYRQDGFFVWTMFLFPIITYFIFKTSENHIALIETNKYRLEVIKNCNPNLTEKEAEIIAENISIIDYMPLFLDYRTKKNAEFEKLKKEQLAAKEKQQEIKKKEDKKILNDFLSKKCNSKDEKC